MKLDIVQNGIKYLKSSKWSIKPKKIFKYLEENARFSA